MSYYKIIGGIRYERSLLETADAFVETGEQISLREIQILFSNAMDRGFMTETERRTLIYITKMYKLSEKATEWIEAQLGINEPAVIEETIQKVIRGQWGLGQLRVEIAAADVQAYQSASTRSFESVLYGAIDAYLNRNHNQLGFSMVAKRRDASIPVDLNPTARLKSILDEGILYLIPMDTALHDSLPYDLPEKLDFDNFWNFALLVEEFEPLVFHAFVLRNQQSQHSVGNFSRKADIGRVVVAAIAQFAQFPEINHNIDPAEVSRQLPIIPGQNFGNALFAALDSGIYNRESSFSFGDAVGAEVWSAPTLDITPQMREYAAAGTLHLIPLDYRAQTNAGTAAFPVPEQLGFWLDGEWIFGLEMSSKTDFRAILSAPRDGNDGQTAWSDTFFDTPASLETIVQKVVQQEFKIDGFQVSIDADAFAAQRSQYGPEWSRAQVILRQAINTMLFDDISPNSVYNTVATRHEMEVPPESFDDPKEYQEAVQHIIKNYLREGSTLELFSGQSEDEIIAPQGENIEQNWIFRTVLPNLLDHYFWLILPRMPEEGQLPTSYVD